MQLNLFPRLAMPMLAVLLSLHTNTASAHSTHHSADMPAKPAKPNSSAACNNDSGWDDPGPARKIFGNTWYVGTCGITALLITSPDGHILIDGATEIGGKLIEGNIVSLGFSLRDVRHILISHEHHDHVGGLAHLQRVTGAQVHAMPPADAVLRSGKNTRQDPQFLELPAMQKVANVQTLADGQVLQLGTLKLTAHATPGHSPGGTSWTWQSCEGKQCHDMAYVDSISAISDNVFRYSDEQSHPGYVATFKQSLAKIAALRCDVLITPHPQGSKVWERIGDKATQALVDPQACRQYAARGLTGLEARLTKEGTAK